MFRRCLFLMSSLCISLSAQAITSVVPSIRGVQLGIPCDAVTKAEMKLGSAVHPSHTTQFLTFDGTESGHKAFMLYTCQSGEVTKQIITIDLADKDQAFALARDLEKEFQSEFGEPKLDLISRTFSAFFRRLWLRFEMRSALPDGDPIPYSAMWDMDEVGVFLTIEAQEKLHVYRVSISQDMKRSLEPGYQKR
jgi:hypothetical protein